MGKTNKKINNFSHRINELLNKESSSFVMGDKALYLKLIDLLNKIDILKTPTNEVSLLADFHQLIWYIC